MTLYHFHIHNDVDVADQEGTELADLEAAREFALDAARDLVCASIHEYGGVNLDHYIDVADGGGRPL